MNLAGIDFVYIILNVFRIGRNDGAVVVVAGIGKLIALVRNTRIKNPCHTVLNQPGNMSVGQLGRIAFGLTGDGFNAQFINLSRGIGRGDKMEFQLFKQHGPEGKILVHI